MHWIEELSLVDDENDKKKGHESFCKLYGVLRVNMNFKDHEPKEIKRQNVESGWENLLYSTSSNMITSFFCAISCNVVVYYCWIAVAHLLSYLKCSFSLQFTFTWLLKGFYFDFVCCLVTRPEKVPRRNLSLHTHCGQAERESFPKLVS